MAATTTKTTTKTSKVKSVKAKAVKPVTVAKETKVKKTVDKTVLGKIKTNKLTRLLKKGMTVEILSGKYKGQKSQVVRYKKGEGKVWLEKINEQVDYKKNQTGNVKGAGGGKTYKPMPLYVSKVKIVLNKNNK